ncbi:MAG: hypothetical protein AAB263_12815 [Planctomycetota bacterium]
MAAVLAKATAWTLMSNAAMAASQWAVLAVCARLVSTAALGELAWAMAVVLPLHLCAGLQQRTAVATAGPGTVTEHIRVRLVTATVVALVATIVACSAPASVLAMTLWLALARGAEGIGEIALGRQQRVNGFAAIAWAQAARAVLQIVGAVVGVWLGHSAVAIAAGVAAGSVVALLAVELPLIARVPMLPDQSRRAWPLLVTLLPLGAGLGLYALATSVPRLVLEAQYGHAALGLFAGVAAAVALLNHVVGAMTPGAATTMAEAGRAGDAAGIRRLVAQLAGLGIAAAWASAMLSWFIGGPVLTLIFGRDFADLGRDLAVLCGATAIDLAALPVCVALTALGVWREQLPMLAVMVGVAALAAWFAIPHYGLAGVSLALAIAFCVRLVWATSLLRARLAQLAAS